MASESLKLSGGPSTTHVYALRLKPGDDLRRALEQFSRERSIGAGAVVTCVGSLSEARLRLSSAKDYASFHGPMEIVSLVGTLSPSGVHLHISLSDVDGRTIGGHVVEGCVIYTTAEIVIADLDDIAFSREPDEATGYNELFITPRDGSPQ